jgi:L-ascorbate metabolism protein UlaG (beta-lactamase superfamily)
MPNPSEELYLRPNVQVEPLVDRWYAWPHLIPPATGACNMVQRHLKIMDSYIAAPQAHAAAVRNPKMLGGPFMDLGGGRVDEVKALKGETLTNRAKLFQLFRDLLTLDALLGAKAKGFSLQPLYSQVPPNLRGYVELHYDLNNSPSFRLIEPLFYKSDYYDSSGQSLMLSLISGDDRPFVLSTPRLASPGMTHLEWCFSDQRVDRLFRLKTEPRTMAGICDMLETPEREAESLRPFLTTEPPPAYSAYAGPGIRWRYFGHACILVEGRGTSILVDPVLSYTYEAGISRYTYADLPAVIDYVLVTHNHQDHLLFETMLQLRHKVRNVIVPRNGGGMLQDPSLKLILENTGFKNVRELSEAESVEIDGGSITGLPFFGEHCDLAVNTKLSYLIHLGQTSLLFAADSCNIEPRLYEVIHRHFGDIDVLFLGMECDGGPLSWLYGPLLLRKMDRAMDESRRLNGSNFEQANNIVKALNCKHVYVYAMGQEPWLNYIMSIRYTAESRPIVESNKLIADCTSSGIVAERLFREKEIVIEHNASRAVVNMGAGTPG